ncbi:MAG TPA: efflux RND transporter periplasmic adaptor subunit [Gemmatimonadaceae bacterium]
MRTIRHIRAGRPRLAFLILALPVAAAAAAGCGGRPAEAASVAAAGAPVRDTVTLEPEAVRLAGLTLVPADSQPWREAWSVPARLVLDPAETQALGAVAEGRVTRVLVEVGDRVRAGQLLVAIHSHEVTDARSALAVAAAAETEATTSLGVAESAAARAERLHALRALSLADLERARGELAVAVARQAQARAEVARATAMVTHLAGGATPAGAEQHEVLVRSPVDGVVVSREARPGAVVLVGAPLVTVGRASSLLLTLHLPEQAVGVARVGADVVFGTAAFPGERFAARVTRVAPTLDSLTRTVEVRALVLGGADRLRAEMYATAELLASPGAPALVVPAAALQALDGDTVVVTGRAQQGGVLLEAVRVRVGRRTATQAEIVAGLAPGTPVVDAGAAVARAELLRRRAGE